MKIWTFAILSILCGVAVGVGITQWELADRSDVSPADLPNGNPGTPGGTPDSSDKEFPLVVVEDSEEFNFGRMEFNSTESHVFVFRNEGDAPLELTLGETTCRCTLSEIGKDTIEPGGSAEVTVEWTATTRSPEFRQSATIETNDPRHPSVSLVVFGQVTLSIRAQPEDIAFSDISATSTRTAYVRIYGYGQKPLEIEAPELTTRETAGHFEAKLRRLEKEELAEEAGAKSGLELSVTVKPGLPLGPILQTIRLRPNVPDVAALEIPIGGRVVGDISVIAVKTPYDRQTNVLSIGSVRSSQGRTVTLFVLVKGAHREQVRLKLGRVVPDFLKVTLGERAPIGDAVYKFPVTIEIPPGSRSVSHMGWRHEDQGQIVIETTHPHAKQLPIFLRFAVIP